MSVSAHFILSLFVVIELLVAVHVKGTEIISFLSVVSNSFIKWIARCKADVPELTVLM